MLFQIFLVPFQLVLADNQQIMEILVRRAALLLKLEKPSFQYCDLFCKKPLVLPESSPGLFKMLLFVNRSLIHTNSQVLTPSQ